MERFPQIVSASDRSLLVLFGRGIGLEPHRDVMRWMATMEKYGDPFVQNLHPAYSSVLVSYDPGVISDGELRALLEERLRGLHEVELPPARGVEVPVCYSTELGPDLAEVAALCGLSIDEVVRLHCETEYRVYFLGFSPGFPYLGGMSPRLATARLAAPRTRVPAGSVAIGGAQTGIYPVASPGGWRVIGRTPRRLFRAQPEPWTLLRMGDHVTFRSISRSEFDRIAGEK